MNIETILYLGMIITGIPMGVFIDWLANQYGLPTQDGFSPIPWALLGLVWPVTLLPFLVYCLWYKKKKTE